MRVYRSRDVSPKLAQMIIRIRENVLYHYWINDVARMVMSLQKKNLGKAAFSMDQALRQVWN